MLLLATEVWKSHGGVQRYMQMLVRILADSGEPSIVVSLLDDQREDASFVSCAGSKWIFCWKAFRLALRHRGGLAIVGHVGLLPLAWILRQLGLIERYAVVLHGIEAWRRLTWLWRLAARGACTVIATTRYTAREFCFHNQLNNARCAIIPLACSFPAPSYAPAAIQADFKILAVTRLSSADTYKGVDTLLEAVRRARALNLDVTLDLIGDGDDRRRLENLALSLEIQDAVCFRGSVNDEELEGALRESHVFAMPSKKEGFGIVYLEAMAAGLPCIGANHGGTPEVIEHGESGFLIEYGDADRLAFYLRALMQSPSLYAVISAAARRRATETLSFEVMSESWHRLLRSLSPDTQDEEAKLPRVVS